MFVLLTISLVGAIGLFNVYNEGTGAAVAWGSNPGRRNIVYNQCSFYCRSQADCAFNEVCTGMNYATKYGKVCSPSHECARDMDCLNLGYNPTQMECVKNWCHVKE